MTDTKKVMQLDEEASSSSSSSSPSSPSLSNSSSSSLADKREMMEFPKVEAAVPTDDEDSSPPNYNYYNLGVEERTSSYDPTRIPGSIFSCRPSTCCDWSINSNESLFSIRMGNNSFSKDLAFIVYKSGELLRLDDEVFSHPTTPLPPLAELAGGGAALTNNKFAVPGAGAVINNKAATITVGEEDRKKMKLVQKPADDVISSTTSDGSDNSHCSFAFPILIGNNKAEMMGPVLPSSQRVSLKKALMESTQQPRNRAALNTNTPPKSSSGLLSTWLSCSCCPFLRK